MSDWGAPALKSLQYFIPDDEIWIKLDAGAQAHMDRSNRSQVALDKVLANILRAGRERPIIIQSLFPMIDGQAPEEIDEYIRRLDELKQGGAQISQVVPGAFHVEAKRRCCAAEETAK